MHTRRSPVQSASLVCLLLSLTICAAPGSAAAQKQVEAKKRNAALNASWRKACERIRDGDPWGAIADDLEAALSEAGGVDSESLVAGYLASLRAAERDAPDMPKNRIGASPQELIKLLTDSRLLNEQSRPTALIRAPLHTDSISQGGRMHWDELGDQLEHDYTDPVIRIYKRGRKILPMLIEALEDMTATRCTAVPAQSNYPALMFRRCDLAMALLEAIARCRFYTVKRGNWFSHLDEDARSAAASGARQWWENTKDMSPLEARSWLISRVKYKQAQQMITRLHIEGHTSRAIEHLRAFLVRNDNAIRMDVVRDLASLGDSSGIDLIVERRRGTKTLTQDEVATLLTYGGRREGMMLRDLLEDDLPAGPKGKKNAVSKAILTAIADQPQRPMVIAILAVLLDPEDEVVVRISTRNKEPSRPSKSTRADAAATYIQYITQRDFRYDPFAEPELRHKAIERVRDWWEREGRGLHGFESARVRRHGGIR
ncbi:MAG: hypothetical protein V3W34_19990 [Phycisphaerae bacterium]